MQDRYAGDVGNFVKYGLLRAIREGKQLRQATGLSKIKKDKLSVGNRSGMLQRMNPKNRILTGQVAIC